VATKEPLRRVAILQSNYIPWKGYFDLIASVDDFVFFDDVQYTKNDWRNRNRIKTPQGTQWLTIPVGQNIRRRICDVTFPSQRWRQDHWKTLEQNYRKAAAFSEIADWLRPLYLDTAETSLSRTNRAFIAAVCRYLGITTSLSSSTDHALLEGQNERLVAICRSLAAGQYISGPAAKAYLDVDLFSQAGISVVWFDYGVYPDYPQLWGAMDHHVSILDLLFNCGRSARNYMKIARA